MTERTDAQLLQLIEAGSESALHQLYQRHHAVVYQFALRTLNNAADAAEVLNEVMLEVWRRAGSFAGQSQVRTWLLGITRHKAVDLLRRKRPSQALELLEEDPGTPASCESIDALALQQQGAQVRRCLDRLKETHRQVVYLTFYEELPYPEIATIMGIPLGTVKTRMAHAKQQLLQCLGRVLDGAH